MRRAHTLVTILVVGSPASALAGPATFGWLTSTETLPARGTELAARISDDNDRGPQHVRSTSLLLGPAVGASNCLELRLPVEMTWESQTGLASQFRMSRVGAAVHYRLPIEDPIQRQAFAPLVRAGLFRDVTIRTLVRVELGLAASYDVGRVRFSGEAGLIIEANFGVHKELESGAGASLQVSGGTRLGAEVYYVHSTDSVATSWAVAGPNVAWSHGPFWLAASVGIGLRGVSHAGRLLWAVGF